MAHPAFSERGEKPTVYECDLLAQCCEPDPRMVRQLWINIAQRIGIQALCVVLDELGGDPYVSLPSRRMFFQDLHRARRNAQIVAMAASMDPLTRGARTSIARAMRVHRRTVDRALRASRVTRADAA